MKSACLVLEGLQCSDRGRGARRQEGRRKDLSSFELSYQNLISLPLEKEEDKHQRTLCCSTILKLSEQPKAKSPTSIRALTSRKDVRAGLIREKQGSQSSWCPPTTAPELLRRQGSPTVAWIKPPEVGRVLALEGRGDPSRCAIGGRRPPVPARESCACK